MPVFALFNKSNLLSIFSLLLITALVFSPLLGHQGLIPGLMLHCLAVILLFFFLRQLEFGFLVALGAAIIFAIHPTRVESLSVMTNANSVLYACFYIGACVSYLRGSMILGGVFGILSILVNVMGLSLPLMLLLLDWYRGKRIDIKVVVSKWPFVLISILVGVLMYWPQFRWPTINLMEAPLIFIWAAMFYIRQFFAPMLVLPLNSLPLPISLLNPAYLIPVVLGLVVLLGVWLLRWQRQVIFACVFFFLSILMVLPWDRGGEIAQRFMYLPVAGFCVLIALGLERAYIFLKTQEAIIRILFYLAVAALMLGFGLSTFEHAKIWRDPLSRWQYQIRHAPNAIAYNNLAQIYRNLPQRDNDHIISLYRKAIDADKQGSPVYYNRLADFYREIGAYAKAVEAYTAALGVDPKDKIAHFGLAAMYQLQQQTAKAVGVYNQLIKFYPDDDGLYIDVIEAYGKAIKDNPNDVVYQEKREELLSAFEQVSMRKKYTAVDFYNLGFLYQQVGGREEAMRYYTKALRLQPNYAQAMYNLANLYQGAGDMKMALMLYQRLVRAHPRFTLGYLNMGIIFNSLGDHAKAKQLYLKVIALEPENSAAYFHLGYLSESQGELQEAVNYYEKAIDEHAKNPETYYNLGNVYAKLGQSAEAIAMYLKTVGVDPKHQDAYVNLSIISFKLRDFQGAIHYLEQAQTLGYNAPAEYLKTLEPYRKK